MVTELSTTPSNPRRSPRRKSPSKAPPLPPPSRIASPPPDFESTRISLRTHEAKPSSKLKYKNLVENSSLDGSTTAGIHGPIGSSKSEHVTTTTPPPFRAFHSPTISVSENKTVPFPSFHNDAFGMSSTQLGSETEVSKKWPPGDTGSRGGVDPNASFGNWGKHKVAACKPDSKTSWFDESKSPVSPLTLEASSSAAAAAVQKKAGKGRGKGKILDPSTAVFTCNFEDLFVDDPRSKNLAVGDPTAVKWASGCGLLGNSASIKHLPNRHNGPPFQQDALRKAFVDPLDIEIASWDPQIQGLSPPPGILNLPFHTLGPHVELPSFGYDVDWDARLCDPMPGAGVYVGELKDPLLSPKDQNVVYISLDLHGEPVVFARPCNRRGQRVPLNRYYEVAYDEIEFTPTGTLWMMAQSEQSERGGGAPGMKILKKIARERLYAKIELDGKRAGRFEKAVQQGWVANKSMWIEDEFESTSLEFGQ